MRAPRLIHVLVFFSAGVGCGGVSGQPQHPAPQPPGPGSDLPAVGGSADAHQGGGADAAPPGTEPLSADASLLVGDARPLGADGGGDGNIARTDGGNNSGPPLPALPGKRDPFLWPFARTSIWNMPIGSGAIYKPAHLSSAANVGVDIQHILRLQATDPEQPVLNSPTWGPGRCTGTTPLGFSVRIPDAWTVPDAGKSPYGGTPNSNFALLQIDGDQLIQGPEISRCVAGGPVYLPSWLKSVNNQGHESVRGDGISGGGQGASSMSTMGGTVRKGELIGDVPIRHAIKINPYAKKYLYYDDQLKGHRWPAKAADSYAKGTYGGKEPSLMMGSLLAIPPDVTEASLLLTTAAGRKLFFVLQNYGVYFTEDTAWDNWDIIVERDAEKEFSAAYGFNLNSAKWRTELNILMKALSVVDNNSPNTIGGGGTPRQPLAPDFQ